MHSTLSDGWRDPDEVAHLAADRGIRVMALTDHDTLHGIGRARAVAHRRGLGYVPALEVTTYPPNQMRHILGHGVDPQHPGLLAMIRRTQAVFRRQTEAWITLLMDDHVGRDLHLEAFNYKPTLMPGSVLKLLLQHRLMSEREAWDSVRRATTALPAGFDEPIPSPAEAVETIHAKLDSHAERFAKPRLLSTEHFRLDSPQPNAHQKELLDHAKFLMGDFKNHRNDFAKVKTRSPKV